MKNIREFDHKLKEVYHVKIASQLLKLGNLEVQFGVPILKTLELRKNET